MAKKNSITLGSYPKYFWKKSLKLTEEEIKKHVHVMGLTGQGKSKLLAHMSAEMIMMGRPISVLDPHSDLANDILTLLYEKGYFDKHGYSKLIYVDFSKTDRFLPFNVLNQPYDIYTVARNIVEVCTRVWPSLSDGASPLFEQIVLASVPVLIQNKLPLTALDTLLTNKPFREQLLKNCTDDKIVSFFHDQFDTWGRDTPMMIGSALRRAFLLNFTPVLRYSLGHKENVLNFRKIMDEQISVIFNLGDLDEETQKIIGCLITVGFEQAALSRADIPEQDRKPYQLIVDEFPLFASASAESLSRMLSLVRKFGLTLTLANQSWSQSPKRLQGAMDNCMPIYFRLGYDDATWSAPRIGGFDPLLVKELSSSTKNIAISTSYMEQYETWTRDIANLGKRECFVNGQKIKTIDVKMNPASASKVDHIRDYYNHALLVRKENIIPLTIEAPAKAIKRKSKVV